MSLPVRGQLHAGQLDAQSCPMCTCMCQQTTSNRRFARCWEAAQHQDAVTPALHTDGAHRTPKPSIPGVWHSAYSPGHMVHSKMELSGQCLTEEKLKAALAALLAPDCPVTLLCLFHNTPEQTQHILSVLAAGGNQLTQLFLGEIDCMGAESLCMYLQSTCWLQELTLQRIDNSHGRQALAALGPGMVANSSLQALHLAGCDAMCSAGLCSVLF